ncbi:MAG: hypothetical protein ACM3H8_08510, partial [Sphingobacteriales bacterium]
TPDNRIFNIELLRIKNAPVNAAVNLNFLVPDLHKTGPIIIDFYKVILKSDAFMISIAGDWATPFAGVGGAIDIVLINKGNDKGLYFYRALNLNYGLNASIGVVAGTIDFNYSSGKSLNRNTFTGWAGIYSIPQYCGTGCFRAAFLLTFFPQKKVREEIFVIISKVFTIKIR